MRMDTFLTWAGWSGVSAIAQILALATLVVGFWRFVVQRRQIPLFHLTWDFIATQTRDGLAYHVVEFRNVGRGMGQLIGLTVVGARPFLTEGYFTPTTLGSGEAFRLLIEPADLSKAWVRWMVRTPDHRMRVHIKWCSLTRTGDLADVFDAASEAYASRNWIKRIRDRWWPDQAVRPGGTVYGVVYAGKHSARLAIYLGVDDAGSELFFPTQPGDAAIPDLPRHPDPLS